MHVIVRMAHDENLTPATRRPKAPGRRNRIAVTYTDAELADIRAAAERSRKAVAAWLGMTGLAAARSHQVPATEALRDLLRAVISVQIEASRQGNNLNQAVTQLHSAATPTPAIERRLQSALDSIDGVLREINATIRDVRGKL